MIKQHFIHSGTATYNTLPQIYTSDPVTTDTTSSVQVDKSKNPDLRLQHQGPWRAALLQKPWGAKLQTTRAVNFYG